MRSEVLFLGAVALTGCTSIEAYRMGPVEAVPVAPDAPETWAAAGVAGEVGQGDWTAGFNDAVMRDLIAEALRANPSLSAQLAQVRAAAADARAERGNLLPFVSGSVSAGGARTVFEGADGDAIDSTDPSYGLGLNASWEADLWGRLQAGVNIAETDLVIAEADLAAGRLSIAARTALAWINLNAAIAQERVAEATLEARTRTVTITERRFARGLSTALDVRTARSARAGAEAALAARQNETGDAARRLEVLLGRYPAAEIDAPAVLPALSPIEPVSSPTLLLARRPDIALAEARVVQSGLRAEQARLALLPSLNLTASVSTDSDDLANVVDPAFIAARAIANLTQPLYAGGQLTARAEAFIARMEASVANYADAVLTAWREVEDALAADAFLAQQEDAQARALEEAAFAEEIAERQYQAGTVSIFNLIDAQTRRLNAESNLVLARSNRATNRVQYYLALGGGLPADLLPDTPQTAGNAGRSPTP